MTVWRSHHLEAEQARHRHDPREDRTHGSEKHFNTFIIAPRVVKPNAQLDTTSKARGDVGNARHLDEIERPSRILTPPSPLLPFDCLQKRRKKFPVVV
jgi:hypothetical protein